MHERDPSSARDPASAVAAALSVLGPSEAAASPDALPAGTQLGEYRLKRVLGQGGFGVVYEAEDVTLQRRVAVKEYLPLTLASRSDGTWLQLRNPSDSTAFSQGLRTFVEEARLLAQFDHPSLVRVYRYWEQNRTAYIAMPYYDGRTLQDTRADLPGPPDEYWLREHLLLPLLGALEQLHARGCLHRDVSPGNILMVPEGRPVLLDFGAARRVITDMTQSLTSVLNPAFAPVELYAESAEVRQGTWSDIYSLAAVTYFALTGHAPVAAPVRAVQMAGPPMAIAVRDLTRLHPGLRYSTEFVDALDRALAVHPSARLPDVAAFRAALGDGSRGTTFVDAGLRLPPPAAAGGPMVASPPSGDMRPEGADRPPLAHGDLPVFDLSAMAPDATPGAAADPLSDVELPLPDEDGPAQPRVPAAPRAARANQPPMPPAPAPRPVAGAEAADRPSGGSDAGMREPAPETDFATKVAAIEAALAKSSNEALIDDAVRASILAAAEAVRFEPDQATTRHVEKPAAKAPPPARSKGRRKGRGKGSKPPVEPTFESHGDNDDRTSAGSVTPREPVMPRDPVIASLLTPNPALQVDDDDDGFWHTRFDASQLADPADAAREPPRPPPSAAVPPGPATHDAVPSGDRADDTASASETRRVLYGIVIAGVLALTAFLLWSPEDRPSLPGGLNGADVEQLLSRQPPSAGSTAPDRTPAASPAEAPAAAGPQAAGQAGTDGDAAAATPTRGVRAAPTPGEDEATAPTNANTATGDAGGPEPGERAAGAQRSGRATAAQGPANEDDTGRGAGSTAGAAEHAAEGAAEGADGPYASEPGAPPAPTARAACGSRTNFSLYNCMQYQCKQQRYYASPACVRLRLTDEVEP